MPYFIFLIFLAFATAVTVTSQQLDFDLYLPVMGLSILIGQIAIFCFTSGAVLLNSCEKKSGMKIIHYGISFSLIVITSIYYLYNSLDPKYYKINALYIIGTWFSITTFDAVFKFIRIGLLNINSDKESVVKSTRFISAFTLILCLFGGYILFTYFLNIDLKINL